MTIHVLRAGLHTTVQDAGRFGWQSLGIGPGGAMDPDMLRLANLLVGNDPGAAGLELTLVGPVLRFERDALVTICGGGFSATVGGDRLPPWRAVFVRAGCEMTIGHANSGCRATLAVAGGIDVPVLLGSRSTNLRAHFGGMDGRAVRAGDQLPVGECSDEARRIMERLERMDRRWVADGAGFSREFTANPDPQAPLRLLPGAQFDQLTEESLSTLLDQPFHVSQRSDRMGYRLEGAALELSGRKEMTSEGVVWGTVQLPPDGQPIILLADRQTTGGYPVIGNVASVDRRVLAQKKPGDAIQFEMLSLEEAQQALADHDRHLRTATQALRLQRAQA